MPFNIWCDGCKNHIAKSVRFNAEKRHIDNYFSTPVFTFSMQCHLCSNIIEIQTNPKNAEYLVTKGGRKKMEEWQPEMNETLALTDSRESEKMAKNAMSKLEHLVDDQNKVASLNPVLSEMQEAQSVWKDDFSLSKRLRRQLRQKKAQDAAEQHQADELRKRVSPTVPILPENESDVRKAKLVQFSRKKETRQFQLLKYSSIFSKPLPQATPPTIPPDPSDLDFKKTILPRKAMKILTKNLDAAPLVAKSMQQTAESGKSPTKSLVCPAYDEPQ